MASTSFVAGFRRHCGHAPHSRRGKITTCRGSVPSEDRRVVSSTAAVTLPVAIGVPVAQISPYYYSYQAYAQQSAFDSSETTVEAIAARVVDKLRGGNPAAAMASPAEPSRALQSRTTSISIVGQKCVACHSGPNGKAGLSLTNLAVLDCSTRLKAVRAVLSERMPKDGPRLTPEEAGKVLEELSARPGRLNPHSGPCFRVLLFCEGV